VKGHVTLKTGVMMLKIQLHHHRNKLHFKVYSNRKKLFHNLKKNNTVKYYIILMIKYM